MASTNLLNLTSYNCRSFGADKYKLVRDLVSGSTFVLLQEIWQYEKQFIENVRRNIPNIDCVVSSPMDENVQSVGRGKGGVAILWKNNLNCKIEIIKCTSKRLCAIKILIDDFKCVLFNVYMPTDPGRGNYDITEYNAVLDEISTILLNSDTQISILGGDWNSDISRDNVQANNFVSFINEESLSLCLNYNEANIPYTFHNEISKSTVDHFIVTNNLFSSIICYESLFSVDDFSDHVPIQLKLKINVKYYDAVPRTYTPSTAWHKCSNEQINEFSKVLDNLLLQINIQHEAITCNTLNCKQHNEFITKLYQDVINYCLTADNILPNTSSNSNNSNIVAGWNEYVREHRETALYWHHFWIDIGRPPQGDIGLSRRRTRSKYHYAIRYVNKERNRIRSNRMAEEISNKNDRNLWNEARQLK